MRVCEDCRPDDQVSMKETERQETDQWHCRLDFTDKRMKIAFGKNFIFQLPNYTVLTGSGATQNYGPIFHFLLISY